MKTTCIDSVTNEGLESYSFTCVHVHLDFHPLHPTLQWLQVKLGLIVCDSFAEAKSYITVLVYLDLNISYCS